MITSLHSPKLALPVNKRDHIRGTLEAPVTLVEYGDYECPHCGATHQIVNELQTQVGDKMSFVFRNFPLTMIHPHALQAAEAAEAAGAQGKFWEMHDILFERQQNLDETDLLAYAEALGLDMDRFEQDLIEHVYVPLIQEDFRSGVRSGVNGTPSFFINGVRHNGGYDLRSLMKVVLAVDNES